MVRDRWTFVVVRGVDGPVRQFSLSERSLRALIGGAPVLALMLAAAAILMGVEGSARIDALRLEARNEALRSELEDVRLRMTAFEGVLDQVAENDARVRLLAGMESVDPEVLQAGVGGPGLAPTEPTGLATARPSAVPSPTRVSRDLGALERRGRLLAASLSEAADSLLAHRELLESTPTILPAAGWLSSAFAASRLHPVHHRPLPHEGVDIAAEEGTPILAAAKGRVVRAGHVIGYGLTVEIDHGFGYSTLYGHASELIAQRGQEVKRGDVIARVGSTGLATASHLHYEVHVEGVPRDPASFILPEAIRY